MMIKTPFYLAFLLFGLHVVAQDNKNDDKDNYIDFPWKKVATQMPDEWYATADAKKVAENVLFCQQNIGGWAKNKPYHHSLTAADSAEVIKIRSGIGATIDNGATTMEMVFLAKVYSASQHERYYQAFHKALNYLLEAQYGNGGWPQFFPFRKGSYASHITYNDNAMVNVLNLLRDVSQSKPLYAAMPITADMKEKAARAFEKGIDCILKTQIIVKGQPTVWCAQHDENTLLPANARAYELASFSGAESVGILQLLMEIENPSQEIKQAITSGVKWLDEHKITGIKVVNQPDAHGKKNMVVVADPKAPPLLARFYDLETGKPFFCDRDGIKKSSLAEIGDERRNGYSWYSNSFEGLKKKYDKWVGEWEVKERR
jgi:pectinesterase